MVDELPEAPARVRSALHQRSLSSLRKSSHEPRPLEPVVDWDRWQVLQDGGWLNTAANNVGEAVGAGSIFGGGATAILVGAPHMFGAEAVPLFCIAFAGVGAYAFACAIAGAIHKPKLKAAKVWLSKASHARLDAWLRAEYGIVPKGKIFNDDDIIDVVNSNKAIQRPFVDASGKFFRVQREKNGGVLELIADPNSSANKAVAPAKLRQVAQPTQVQKVLPEPAKPVDPLSVFSRADRLMVQQALTLAEELVASSDLTTEQRYEAERAQRVLKEAIELAGKLVKLSAPRKRAAFVDLMESVTATLANLKEVAEQRDAALVRDVEVLRNYTAALNPKASPFSLPE